MIINIRKLTAAAVTAIIIAASSAAVNAADANPAELLSALGFTDVFNDGGDMSGTVTRGEFAAVMADFTAGASSAYSEYYKDVPKDHKFASGIMSVTNAGYMIGDETGGFKPDEPITGSEAVTVCLKVLGYQNMANSKGGYYAGYLKAAQESELSGFMSHDGMTREQVCRLVYEMLDSRVIDVSSYNELKTEYSLSEETLAEAMFKIYKGEGRVTGTPLTGLRSGEGTARGQVMIDGVKYATALDVLDDIGRYVSFRYRDDGDDRTLIYMCEDGDDKVITVDSRDIDECSEYVYTYDGRKTAKMSLDVTVIYNGCYVRFDDLSADELVPADGTVRLISTRGDKLYDILIITNYEYYTVKSVSTTDMKIFDKYGKEALDMDDSDTDRFISFDAYGKTIALSYFKENDVLQVYKSKNGRIINVSMVTEKVQGIPQAIDTEDNIIVLEGTKYNMLPGLDAAVTDSNGVIMREAITCNSYGSFYINPNGVVVGYISSVNTDTQTGFVMGIYYIPDELEHETLCVKILTDTSPVRYYTTEKLYYTDTISGTRKRYTAAELYKKLSESGKDVRDVYRFRLNADGLVTELIPPQDMTADKNYQGYSVDTFAKDWDYTGVRIYTQKIGTRYIPDGTTKVFKIPVDPTAGDDMYETGTMSGFFGSDARDLHISVYGADADAVPAAVVWWSEDIGKSKSSIDGIIRNNPLIISSVSKAILSDDEKGYILKGYQAGTLVELEVIEDVGGYSTTKWGYGNIGIEDLGKGDVIHFDTNSKGQINYILPMFVLSKKESAKGEVLNSGTIYDYDALAVLHTLHGQVVRSSTSTITVNAQANLDPAYNRTYSVSTAKVILVEDGTVQNISIGDVQKGDEVFLRDYHHVLYDVVIYR